jgi:hypothetical protein
MEPINPLAQFVAVHAEIDQTRIFLSGKIGIDEVAEILAEPGTDGAFHFYISHHVIAPIVPAPLYRELSHDELPVLLAALRKEEQHPPATIDLGVLRIFVHQLAWTLEHQPSARFNGTRFGAIVRTASGAIVGHFGIGIDMTGTVHDTRRSITVEQHMVPLHPNRFRRLNEADRLSLASALNAAVNDGAQDLDPLWEQILQDLTASSADR